jgi:carbonic anhydrase
MNKLFLPLALAALSLTVTHAAEHGAPAGAPHGAPDSASHDAGHAHWSYAGAQGASHWGDMQADYATCKLGKAQSPIDIRSAERAVKSAPIGFSYRMSAAEVVNNGHTVQVNLASGGKLKLASGNYKLLQFHFHTPSEEKVNGKSYAMVAHLVHRNDSGKLAVVAVLFNKGRENPALAKVFAVMPPRADGKAEIGGGFNVTDLLPASQGYFAFKGSLTTPPCSEDVLWHVLKQPVELSKGQLATFQKLYPMNARPVQPLNGRPVEENM